MMLNGNADSNVDFAADLVPNINPLYICNNPSMNQVCNAYIDTI
jgi:hypothetical protein